MKDKTKKPESKFEFIKTLAIALVLAGLVRSFLFEPFNIPSSSMKPNLLIGDYLFVSKYSYGYSRYSFPFGLDLFEGRFWQKNKPQRGDVTVFRLPTNPSINYIKRIIGLPGDRIQIINGVVHINGEEVKKSADGIFSDGDGEIEIKIPQFSETLPERKTITVLDQDSTPQDNTGVYEVPAGHYFMMGDNRDNSQDSRFLDHVGFVPEENLVGRAGMIFISCSKPIWQIWTWPTSIRFNRMFHEVK
jgi:signal peptidase I